MKINKRCINNHLNHSVILHNGGTTSIRYYDKQIINDRKSYCFIYKNGYGYLIELFFKSFHYIL